MQEKRDFEIRERGDNEVILQPTMSSSWQLLELEGLHQNITDTLRYSVTSVEIKLLPKPDVVDYTNRGRLFSVTLTFEDDLIGGTSNALNQLVQSFPYQINVRIGTGADLVEGKRVPISVLNVLECSLEDLTFNLSYARNDVAKWVLVLHGKRVKRTSN